MVDEGKKNEEDDKRKKEEADLINRAEHLCYQTERQLTEFKDKLEASKVEELEGKIKSCREALEAKDVERIKTELEALTQASYAITEQMYKDAAASGDNPGEAGAADSKGKDDGHVVDAEFEENSPSA